MAKEKQTTTPRVSILERRLQNPFGEPAVSIRFKRKDITARWFNDGAKGSGGQVHRGRELGWLDVRPDMVEDMDTIGFHTVSPANQITRGPRGEEVLLWMPTEDFTKIQWAKTKRNYELMRDTQGQKSAMVQAAAKTFGDEAGDFVTQHVGIKDSYERIHRTQEPGDG